MTTDLVTYLSFDGRCEAAFKHYEKILGGKILMMMRYADAPADAGVPQNPETAARIMHARLQVGDRLLMGGDAPPQFATKPQGFCVSIRWTIRRRPSAFFANSAKGVLFRCRSARPSLRVGLAC